MDFKEINPLWRLSDPLTVCDAAALIAGFDPNSVDASGNHFRNPETGLTDSDGITGVKTALCALANAINARKLKATIRRTAWERGWNEEPEEDERFDNDVVVSEEDSSEAWHADPTYPKRRGVIYRVSPDWGLTTVAVDDLRTWLVHAGFRTGFFFPAATDAPDYLDPKNLRYAPKLAAAVRVWQAMEDENLRRGKSAKTAMEQWCETRYKELGLIHARDNQKNGTKAGDVNKTAIEEAAKVANWEDGGGAPKTPG